MHPVIPRPHTSMDHRYNSLHFSIQNSNYYSLTSQTFMLQGSHTGPPPVMSWGGSPTAGQPPMWPSPPPGGYWPPPPPTGHPGQSSSTPPPIFRPRILVTVVVGTSSWRASPTMGNASVDDTDAADTATFFFATDSKSFVPTFNCFIHNTSKSRTSRLLIHLCL
jgi:hypothetical protein